MIRYGCCPNTPPFEINLGAPRSPAANHAVISLAHAGPPQPSSQLHASESSAHVPWPEQGAPVFPPAHVLLHADDAEAVDECDEIERVGRRPRAADEVLFRSS